MKKFWLVFPLLVSTAFGQAVRFDDIAQGLALGNVFVPIANGVVTVYNYPGPTTNCALAGSCGLATTYVDDAKSSSCSSPTQLTASTTNTCVGTTDSGGNFGFWADPGAYQYCASGTGFITRCKNIFFASPTSVPGVFTNAQMGLNLRSLVNGCNPLAEYQAAQGANTSSEAVTGCINVPSSSTSHQANGGGFYAIGGSTSTNAVGVYAQCRLIVNGAICWGVNFVSRDTSGLTTNLTLYGNEIDVNPLNPITAYSGVVGLQVELNTIQVTPGTYPGNGAVFVHSSTAGARWFVGFQTADDAAATAGLFGATCTVGDCGSQVLKFRGFNTGSLFTATVGSDSLGNVVLTPAAGKAAKVGANTITVTIAVGTTAMTTAAIAAGACGTTVTVSAPGVLTTDVINHAVNASMPANPGVLIINKWVTADNVNFNYCNPTAASVTPIARTINYSVTR